MKTSREVKNENNNFTILDNDEKKNKDIFPI